MAMASFPHHDHYDRLLKVCVLGRGCSMGRYGWYEQHGRSMMAGPALQHHQAWCRHIAPRRVTPPPHHRPSFGFGFFPMAAMAAENGGVAWWQHLGIPLLGITPTWPST
jgi:hypothetical protein